MFGSNPKRKPLLNDGSSLQVQEIFATMQGEGPFAGRASVFVRLGGCNLACGFCDTEFESFQPATLHEIMQQVNQLAANHLCPLAIITGGEPLRQNISPLCEKLIANNFEIQIETNGTLFQELPAQVQIICSPKAASGYYAPLRPDMLHRTNALKFIISSTQPPYNNVPEIGQSTRPDLPIYVQPMDEYCPLKNARNMAHAIKLSQKHNYNLSIQLHKILDVA
jgi:organic radical activating enzyme